MDPAGLLAFAAIYLVAVASPGPGIALVVARSLGRGLHGLPWFVAGFVVGDLILFALAAGGLAFVAHSFEGLFTAVRLIGAAYLAYLAWRLWNAPVVADTSAVAALRESPLQAFLSSLSLTLGNPKAIIFFLSVMPLVVDLARVDPSAFAAMAAIMVLVFAPVLVLTALMADRARRLLRSPRALRRLNRGTATVMVGAAIAVATR